MAAANQFYFGNLAFDYKSDTMPFKKKIEIREHGAPIYSVVGNGFSIFTSSGDRFVLHWNLKEGTQEHFSIKMDHTSYRLCYHNERLYIGSKKGEIYSIDTKKKTMIAQRKVDAKAIHSILVGDKIMVGTEEGDLLFLDIDTLEELKRLSLGAGKIRDLQFLDSNRLAIAGQDGYLRVILLDSYELEHQFTIHEKGSNKLLIVGEELFSVGKDGYLRVWNWQEEKELHAWPIHYETIYDIRKVGEFIVTASRDKSIKVWEYDGDLKLAQKITSRLFGHSYSVNALHVIDAENFCSVSDDKRIIWWSLETDEINLLDQLKAR